MGFLTITTHQIIRCLNRKIAFFNKKWSKGSDINNCNLNRLDQKPSEKNLKRRPTRASLTVQVTIPPRTGRARASRSARAQAPASKLFRTVSTFNASSASSSSRSFSVITSSCSMTTNQQKTLTCTKRRRRQS